MKLISFIALFVSLLAFASCDKDEQKGPSSAEG
jgi:hypothetical protein